MAIVEVFGSSAGEEGEEKGEGEGNSIFAQIATRAGFNEGICSCAVSGCY